MKKTSYRLLFLCAALLLLTEITTKLLKYDQLFYSSLIKQLTTKQLQTVIVFQKKWQWVSYVIFTILIIIKSTLIASVLYVGMFYKSKLTATFKQLYTVIIKAEFVFLLVPVFKLFWFFFFQTNYNLEDLQYFYPLSALNIIGYKGLDPWLLYPLQTLNLFELAYIIYLSYQIGKLTQTNADTGLKIVGYSYVPALILWVCVVMFLTLNYS